HLVDEAPEERFALRSSKGGLVPEVWERLAQRGEGRTQLARDVERDDFVALLPYPLKLVFSLPQRSQRGFPPPLELGCNETIVRVHLVILPLRQVGLIAEALQLSLAGGVNFCRLLAASSNCRLIQIELCWGQRFKEGLDDVLVNRICRQK